jgi:HK97 family phage major capsid protein
MYADHIASLEATLKEKSDRMTAVHKVGMDEKRSMNTAEAEEFETLRNEIKALKVDIARTQEMLEVEKADIATAKPVEQTTKAAATFVPGSDGGLRGQNLSLKTVEKLEPGIAFARYAMCLMTAKFDHSKAAEIAERVYPQTESVVRFLQEQAKGFNFREMLVVKAAVAAGTTQQATWAAPLVYAEAFGGDFIEYLRPLSLIGQAQFEPLPFNVRIEGQTSGGTAGWVGEGKGKPVTKFDFNAVFSDYTKVAAISAISKELIRLSDGTAETRVRNELAKCVIARLDTDLFDPGLAAVSHVNPAGLLNGVAPVSGPPASGVDADEIRCAIQRLWAPWDTLFMGTRPAYYTTPAVARLLSFMTDTMGNPAFPGITPQGGSYRGTPIRVSQYLANAGGSGGAPLILVDEAEIWKSDDGTVTLDASDQVSIQMDSAPTQDSTVPTATSVVSMWQTNSVAFRAERGIWWGKRRTGAVQWIDGFPTSC